MSKGVDKSSVTLRGLGVRAVTVRNATVHPECRTEEERQYTAQFLRGFMVGNCPRCEQPLAREPNL